MQERNHSGKRNLPLPNVTDGAISGLPIDNEDKIDPNEAVQTTRVSLDYLEMEPPQDRTRYFLEDLRTGEFHEKAERYILKAQKEEELLRSDQFQSQLHDLVNLMTGLIYKFVFFFQGIQAGGLLFILLMKQLLQISIQSAGYLRIDQIILLASLISCFGSLSTLQAAYRKSQESEVKHSATSADDRRFYLLACVTALFFGVSYILALVLHYQIIKEVESNLQTILLIISSVVALMGWFFAVLNSQHFLERSFIEEED